MKKQFFSILTYIISICILGFLVFLFLFELNLTWDILWIVGPLIILVPIVLSNMVFEHYSAKQRNQISNIDIIGTIAKKSTMNFMVKKILLGPELNSSLNEVISQINKTSLPNSNQISNLVAALIKRFLRVNLITAALVLIPSIFTTWILVEQNKIMSEQSRISENQSKIQLSQLKLEQIAEVERIQGINKENLIGIFDLIESDITKNDTISPRTISEIINASRRYSPFVSINNFSELKDTLYSLERTELLIYLLNSKINQESLRKIFANADFRYCDFSYKSPKNKFRILDGINLARSNFSFTDLKMRFLNANLSYCDLSNSNYSNKRFVNCNLQNSNFGKSKLMGTKFIECDMQGSDFSNQQIIKKITIQNCELNGLILSEGYIKKDFNKKSFLSEIDTAIWEFKETRNKGIIVQKGMTTHNIR